MTLLAGFVTQEGVVLCSDSQFSSPEEAGYRAKIISGMLPGGGFLSMALCGDEDYGKDAIETCFEVIGRQTPEKRGVSSVREAVRRVLTKILNEYNKSNLEPSLRPSFLVALGLRETGTVLFTTAETSIRTVAHWQCHGYFYSAVNAF